MKDIKEGVTEMINFGNLKKLKETLNGEKNAEKVTKNFKIDLFGTQ
jgi:hypothetical protein